MNSTVATAIANGLAATERIMDPPPEPWIYGSDISCVSDLDPTMRELAGDDPTVVVEAVVRRLDCPRGALRDDLSYGIDLRGALNRGTTATDAASLASRISGEVLADDRVASARVTVTPSSTGSELSVQITGELADYRRSRFRLVLAVTSAEVLLKEMSAS